MIRQALLLFALVLLQCESFSVFPRFVKAAFKGRSTPSPVPVVTEDSVTMTRPNSATSALYSKSRVVPGTDYGILTVEAKPLSSRLSKVETDGFGQDSSTAAYRSEILDLVYERSMHRMGLDE